MTHEENLDGPCDATVRTGQVVKRENGRKYVARRDHLLPEGAAVVAEVAHEDGDYSYYCGSNYCRCGQ